MAGVMVYLFMSAIAVFEVPAIIGFPSRILVLSALIFTSTNPPTGLPDYGLAGAYGAIMLVAGLTLAYFYVRLVQQGKKYTVITGRGYRPRRISLGRWKWAALAFVMLYLSMEVLFHFWYCFGHPCCILQLPSAEAFAQISLNNYRNDLRLRRRDALYQYRDSDVGRANRHHAPGRAGFWIVVRTQVSFRGSLDTQSFLPHAIPSILLAVGLGYLGLAYRNVFPVYGTIAIIAIAHIIGWIAYGTRTTNGVMIQVHRELEEAGRVSGASTPRVLCRIVLPLVAAGIFNSWIWISMLSYREVTMALALGTRKNLVISTIVWQFWGNGWVPQVAALGVLLVLFAVLVVGILKIGFSRFGGEFGSGN